MTTLTFRNQNNGGYLIDWAKQGVLMLNASLTVRAHNANSHAGKGWESFTEVVLSLVAKNKTEDMASLLRFVSWFGVILPAKELIKLSQI